MYHYLFIVFLIGLILWPRFKLSDLSDFYRDFLDKKHGILQDINSKPHFHKIFSKTTMLSPTRHLYFLIDNR